MATKKEILCDLIREAAQEREFEAVAFLSSQLAKTCGQDQKEREATPATLHPVQGILGTTKIATPARVHGSVCDYLRTLELGCYAKFADIAFNVESTFSMDEVYELDREWHPKERRQRWRNHVSQSVDALRRQGVLEKSDKNRIYRLVRHP